MEEDYLSSDMRNPLLSRSQYSIDSTSLKHGHAVRDNGNVKFIMGCVFTTVVLERLVYYSLLGNLAVFLNMVLDWTPTNAVILTLTFSSLTWISCFLGGLFGDAYLGRFKTIVFGLICYIVGFTCLPFIAFFAMPMDGVQLNGHTYTHTKIKGTNYTMLVWISLSLLLISLGEGFFKANMSPFGADQIMSGEYKVGSFFRFFYWAINIGSFIGFGVMTYLQIYSFMKGYAVAAGCLVIGGVIFCLPKIRRENYIAGRPVVNIMKKIYHIVKEARKNNKKKLKNQRSDGSNFEDFVPIQHWLDRAMVKYGGSHLEVEVEEVKTVLKIIPVFAYLIVYCTLYYQITGTFVLQGMHMNTKVINGANFVMPSAWLGLFNVIFVLIFIPIVDKCLYPCLEKCGVKMPYLVRIAFGMILASVSMVAAGMVEQKRLATPGNITNHFHFKNVTAKDLTVFWQIPQFAIMGLSEIFVMITGLEYAYCKAPKSMQSLVTGLFFIANGIGSGLGSLILAVLNTKLHFIQSKKQTASQPIPALQGRLHYFFYSLAVINVVNWIGFIIFAFRRRDRPGRTIQSTTIDDFIKASQSLSQRRLTLDRSRSLEI